MPIKRRITKGRAHRITPEAIAAFEAGDYLALHAALSLRPWEVSPLPLEVTPLGCGQHPRPHEQPTGWFDSWDQARELQRLLLDAIAREDG